MAAIKQSLAWWCFQRGNVTAEDLLAQAARIGYAGVELCPQDVWPKARDAGLQIVTMGGHASLGDGLNRRENHDRIEREIEANLALAQQWDIPVLIVFSGNRNGLSDEAGLENTVEGLKRVARAAEQAGITLALELLNSKVDHPDYQCDHTAWGAAVCRAVNSPRVKLLYDIYHMQVRHDN
ncbi:MAG TPA: sugar phosphate isomerase/epimerase family protein [Chthonomonadaceae bacterium]|nr:sugar phosphate isomerase/epimerase family protein [Chthonomonadaceae bacterium]